MNQAHTPEETIQSHQKSLDETVRAVTLLQQAVNRAYEVMGQTVLDLARQVAQMGTVVNQLVEDRNQQLELLGRLMQQVETFAKLHDSDHAAIEVLTARLGMHSKKGELN
jgi:hypothetical protein